MLLYIHNKSNNLNKKVVLLLIDNKIVDVVEYEKQLWQLHKEYLTLLDDSEVLKNYKKYKILLLYIAEHVQYDVQHAKPEQVDQIFRLFKRLCTRYEINPTINMFCAMMGYDMSSLDAKYKNNKQLLPYITKWLNECGAELTDSLTCEDRTNVSKIFVAKALYNIHDETHIVTTNLSAIPQKNINEISQKYTGTDTILPDLEDI